MGIHRFHLEDPIYFRDGCKVTLQTIGGTTKEKVLALQAQGVPLLPITIDTGRPGEFVKLLELQQPKELISPDLPDGWCNFWRQDCWTLVAYFYLALQG